MNQKWNRANNEFKAFQKLPHIADTQSDRSIHINSKNFNLKDIEINDHNYHARFTTKTTTGGSSSNKSYRSDNDSPLRDNILLDKKIKDGIRRHYKRVSSTKVEKISPCDRRLQKRHSEFLAQSQSEWELLLQPILEGIGKLDNIEEENESGVSYKSGEKKEVRRVMDLEFERKDTDESVMIEKPRPKDDVYQERAFLKTPIKMKGDSPDKILPSTGLRDDFASIKAEYETRQRKGSGDSSGLRKSNFFDDIEELEKNQPVASEAKDGNPRFEYFEKLDVKKKEDERQGFNDKAYQKKKRKRRRFRSMNNDVEEIESDADGGSDSINNDQQSPNKRRLIFMLKQKCQGKKNQEQDERSGQKSLNSYIRKVNRQRLKSKRRISPCKDPVSVNSNYSYTIKVSGVDGEESPADPSNNQRGMPIFNTIKASKKSSKSRNISINQNHSKKRNRKLYKRNSISFQPTSLISKVRFGSEVSQEFDLKEALLQKKSNVFSRAGKPRGTSLSPGNNSMLSPSRIESPKKRAMSVKKKRGRGASRSRNRNKGENKNFVIKSDLSTIPVSKKVSQSPFGLNGVSNREDIKNKISRKNKKVNLKRCREKLKGLKNGRSLNSDNQSQTPVKSELEKFEHFLFSRKIFDEKLFKSYLKEVQSDYKKSKLLKAPRRKKTEVIFRSLDKSK